MIEITITKETGEKVDLMIPESMKEISARRYVNVLLVIESMNDFLSEFFSLRPGERKAKMESLENLELAQVIEFLIDILEASTGASLDLLKDIPIADHDLSIMNLGYLILGFISNYEPQEMQSFVHRRKTYAFPTKEIKQIGDLKSISFGPDMTFGEMMEALQRNFIFSAKDAEGNPLIKDGIYYSDLGMIASLAREKKPDGSFEEKPVGINAYADFVSDRMNLFSDLPADIFRNAGFFLWKQCARSVKTLITNSSSKEAKSRPMLKRRKRIWRGKSS